MGVLRKIYSMIFYITERLLVLLEGFLFLRLMLKFLNANSKTLVVNLIYKYSDILISPFDFIFTDIHWKGGVIETTTTSAMVGYWILVWVIFRLLRLFSRD